MFRSCLAAIILAIPSALLAEGIEIHDAYARAASPMAMAGAAFMVLENTGAEDDRLLSASTTAAKRVELHTHIIENDVARMVEVEEGFEVPAGGKTELKRGGYHVMLMGLTAPLEQGGEITLDLTFEKSGTVSLTVPVDNER